MSGGPVPIVELDIWRRTKRQGAQPQVPETRDSAEVMMCI